MRLSDGLLKKIHHLLIGETVSASSLKGEWVDILAEEGVLIREFMGSRKRYRISDRESFLLALSDIDERFKNASFLLGGEVSLSSDRSVQAAETGNSKIVKSRSCPGFPVNSYEPIACRLNGEELIVAPAQGSFVFISDWNSFQIPENVIVIGIENMENFRLIREQRSMFDALGGQSPIIFVSRFPQSKDLRQWLQRIPNRYIHFGDFDLAGIKIYETEFAAYLRSEIEGEQRCSMFIPCDIEDRLRDGVKERYDVQLPECRTLTSAEPAVRQLLSLIHKYRRGYDQEGYILHHPVSSHK